MKLKRLILQGFKSFKDRTVIHFDEGITGIVGPNGCGKSNVVDALFWVMGEQSAKHLRGSSMKDVIFAGSSKYSPASFAEVSLVLENSEGKHIHIGHQVASPSEIQLTRKLYRNGETEYRINEIPCRLRDIQEVFMDTGAGAKSYSIIAQGEINRLVQAKPEDRRTIIEDVAGITKFKLRKKESLKKIEQTEQNLARLNDLRQEIDKNLAALAKQAEKAERARELKEKVRRYDLIVSAHKEFDLLKSYKEMNEGRELRLTENESLNLKKNSLEIGLEDERFRKDEETSKIEELQKEFNLFSKELAAKEERLVYLRRTKVEKEKLVEGREVEIKSLEQELAERKAKLGKESEELQRLERKGEEEQDFSLLEERIENLKAELDFKVESFNDLNDELSELKKNISKFDHDIFKNTSKLEEYSRLLQDLTKEIETLETQYSGTNSQIISEREAVASAEKLSHELKDKESSYKEELEKKNIILKENQNNCNLKNKELIQLESRLSSLLALNESLGDASEGMGDFLKEHSDSFTFLGAKLKCPEKYTASVQFLLEDYLETLVATTFDAKTEEEVVHWINTATKGFKYLRPLNLHESQLSSESLERLKLVFGEEIYSLIDILEMDAELKQKLTPFLEGHFVVTDVMSADKMERVSGQIPFKAIATLDGKKKVVNVSGAKIFILKNQNTDDSQGVIARNNLIDQLKIETSRLKIEVDSLESQCATDRDSLNLIQQEFEKIREESIEARAQFAARKSAIDVKLSNFEVGFAKLEILKSRKSEISKSRLEMMELEEKLALDKKKLEDKLIDSEMRFEEIKDEVELQKSSYEEEKSSLHLKQVEARSYQSTLKNQAALVEDLNAQIERICTRLEGAKKIVVDYSSEIDGFILELEQLEEQNKESSLLLSDKEEVLNMMKDNLGQLLLSMKDREDEIRELSSRVNKNSREMTEFEVKLSQCVLEEEQNARNTFEKYQVDLRKVLSAFLEFTPENFQEFSLKDLTSMYQMETEEGIREILPVEFEFVRRYGQDLKECSEKLKNYRQEFNRLGDINWQAIEDYERQKLRSEFLKTQEIELKNSLLDLQKAIAHIDEKSKARFHAAYDEVSARFQKVFPIIFGGGFADLKIVGDVNDPECGIDIVAQPPGKKMQNINLMSGGEKAMTAVSLIFSIFLVKPSPFCLLDEVDAPLDDANVGRFNELLREMSSDSQFILITHNKKTMELNDTLYGVTMQEPGVSKAVSVQLH